MNGVRACQTMHIQCAPGYRLEPSPRLWKKALSRVVGTSGREGRPKHLGREIRR